MADHHGVRIPDVHAAQPLGHGVVVGAVIAHGAIGGQSLAATHAPVLVAVSGRGVHQAGAVFQRHVLATDHATFALAEGMSIGEADQLGAVGFRKHFHLLGAHGGLHLGQQIACHDGLAAIHAHQRIAVRGAHRDGQVRRKRPRRGGPDHQARARVQFFKAEGLRCRGGVAGLEIHPDAGVFAVLVLQLGFGQRRAVGHAPVHRLQLAEHQARVDQVGEQVQRAGLVGRIHGHVRMRVVGMREQPLHALRLHADELGGIGRARLADGHAAHLGGQRVQFLHLALLHQLAHHAMLDGQTVAVPARRVGHAHAFHESAAHHDVLQHLVHHVAHVDRSVGVRRAVMKAEVRRVGALALQAVVQTHGIPARKRGGLALRQVGLHGEVGLRQVQRVLEVGHGRAAILVAAGFCAQSRGSSPGFTASSR